MLLVLLVPWGCVCFRPPMRRPLGLRLARTECKPNEAEISPFALLVEDMSANYLGFSNDFCYGARTSGRARRVCWRAGCLGIPSVLQAASSTNLELPDFCLQVMP